MQMALQEHTILAHSIALYTFYYSALIFGDGLSIVICNKNAFVDCIPSVIPKLYLIFLCDKMETIHLDKTRSTCLNPRHSHSRIPMQVSQFFDCLQYCKSLQVIKNQTMGRAQLGIYETSHFEMHSDLYSLTCVVLKPDSLLPC